MRTLVPSGNATSGGSLIMPRSTVPVKLMSEDSVARNKLQIWQITMTLAHSFLAAAWTLKVAESQRPRRGDKCASSQIVLMRPAWDDQFGGGQTTGWLSNRPAPNPAFHPKSVPQSD